MKEDFKNKLLNELDRAFRWAGEADFETGMQHARKIFSVILERIEEVQTKRDLIAKLDSNPEPTFAEEKFVLAAIRFSPQFLRWGARSLADQLEREIPAPRGGRPAISQQERAAIVAYILELLGRGASLTVSKKRAAARFDYGESTVERIWIERANIDEVDFRSALKWLSNTLESENPRQLPAKKGQFPEQTT